MGIIANNGGGNLIFTQLDFKNGLLKQRINKTDPATGEITTGQATHAGIEGHVISFTVQDKVYEDKGYKQALIRFADGWAVSFSVGSLESPNFGAAHLLGILRNADFTEELSIKIGKTLKGKKIEGRAVDRDFVWVSVKQGDEKIPKFYDNEREGEDGELGDYLPRANEEKRDKKDKLIWADWTDVWAWIEKTLREIHVLVAEANGDEPEALEDTPAPAAPKGKPAPKAKGKKTPSPTPDDEIPM